MTGLLENRLIKILLRNSAIAVAKTYKLFNRSAITPFEELEAISKLKVNGKLPRLYAGEVEAIMTGRFIDILKIYNGNIFQYLTPQNIEKINDELTKCIASKIYKLGPRKTEEVCSNLFGVPIPRDYVHTLIHEYIHWDMLAGTRTAYITEKFSWKERIDHMSFTHLFYTEINLGKIVGEHFARKDKADIIGKGLSENEVMNILNNKISYLINDLAKDMKVINYFLSIINDLSILANIGYIISVFIEPATWALIEDDKYFKQNIAAYFSDERIQEYAERVYEDSKRLNYEKVINKVKRVLQIDLTQLLQKGQDVIKFLDNIYEEFQKDSNSDISFSGASLISVLVDLIIDYSKKPYEREKIDIITSHVIRDKETLDYISKIIFRYKGALTRMNLPSVCGHFEYQNRLIGGCFNPDVGITGDKPVKRPFGSLEEIVGNLALSLKPVLILAYYYSDSHDVEKIKNYKKVVERIAERLKYLGINDFTKIATEEIRNLGIQLDDMFNIYNSENCLNNNACNEIEKSLKEFLKYWTYIVLRLGKEHAALPNRHGIFLF
ncbi:hypothetical protein [Saccharolobus shibatae]|uniref:Uncharacterized protein n=1 Tax=Saccharolobus shibatae TaxID=2286 RepID=A0A8F5BWE1_9CREN|nr:hypothetical protein [Saccharolobus shibatae]QXJ32630.1 hypothetical protein J5U21_02281 [Saccharolobus shibatae]